MLEFYFESDFKLRPFRQCPLANTWTGLPIGYARPAISEELASTCYGGAAHLAHWASSCGVAMGGINAHVLDSFARHLPACVCAHPFQGRDRYHLDGARRLVKQFRDVGVLPPDQRRARDSPALGQES